MQISSTTLKSMVGSKGMSIGKTVEGSQEVSISSSVQRGQTLDTLCGWWEDTKEEPLPSICHQFVNVGSDKINKLQLHDHSSKSFSPLKGDIFSWESFDTGRSISIAGILGGILVILIIIAFFVCLRHRKRYQDQESLGREFLSYELRQLQHRTSRNLLAQMTRQIQDQYKPPDYRSVVQLKKDEEGELPSYSQAVAGTERFGDSGSDISDVSCEVSKEN